MFIKVSLKTNFNSYKFIIFTALSVKHNVLQAVRPSDFDYFCRQQLENAIQKNQA